MDPLLDPSDLPRDLLVPELDLPPVVQAPRVADAPGVALAPPVAEARHSIDAAPAAAGAELELAATPRWHVATGVRSKACPVCLCELSVGQWVCHECGERLGVDHGLVVAGAAFAERASPGQEPHRGALEAVAGAVPMAVGKRLLLYPLLAAFFCNLLIPCRFHQTGACLLLALAGAVVVFAHAAVSARSTRG